MSNEESPKEYSKEEIAHLEETRTISDANLLEHYGGKYRIDEQGNKTMEVSMSGIKNLHEQKKWEDIFDLLRSLEPGDRIRVDLRDGKGSYDVTFKDLEFWNSRPDSDIKSIDTEERGLMALTNIDKVEKV